MLKRFLVGLVIALFAAGAAATEPRNDGQAAYNRADYAAAMQIWKPLAEAGDKYSQFHVGFMYAYGKGVPADFAEAAKWYRLAADQGDAIAAAALGYLYLKGLGVPVDNQQAFVWLKISNDNGDRDTERNLSAAANELTEEQRAEAERMVSEWEAQNCIKHHVDCR
jgi:uncharacterized protein